MLVGGAVGSTVFGAAAGNAQTATTTTAAGSSSGSTANAAPSGVFKPNENATHEAGESAQREAQEDAGQFPTVP